jgi:putative hemolysin
MIALKNNRRDKASEEELREMVDDIPELAPSEKRMIQDIIDLGDMTTSEVCTPRVDVMLVQADESGRVALERMRGTGFSRLPVVGEGIDDVIGIVNIKDLIGPLMDGSIDEPVSHFMYDAMFVPETKNVVALLGEMQTFRQQMAIVVDEYGGTDGVITIEDILEEIVGEIADESDAPGVLLVKTGDTEWKVDGRLPVEDAIAQGWPVEDSPDYETIAGWLIDTLDSVPDTGDEFEVGGYCFKILKMRRSRISTIEVTRIDA